MPHTPGDEIAQSTQQMGDLSPILALLRLLGTSLGAQGRQVPQQPPQMAPNPMSGVQSGLKGAMMGGMQGRVPPQY